VLAATQKLVFYHLTARLNLSPPPGQIIKLGIPGCYSPSQVLTSAAVDYADQFASYIRGAAPAPARAARVGAPGAVRDGHCAVRRA